MSSIFGQGQRESDPFAKLRSLRPAQRESKESERKVQERRLAARRRFRPSADLADVIRRIDLYTDPRGLQDAVDWIKQQYEVHDIDFLLGFFQRCYLGDGFVDHRLSLLNQILEHYKAGDVVPPPFDGARSLAANPAYAWVEVYADGRLVAVREDELPPPKWWQTGSGTAL